MYYRSDLEYMKRELKFSLSLIDYIQKRYGDELSDTFKSRLMYLINSLKELNIDIKFLNQNPEILNCLEVYSEEEFKYLIDYIKKMAKKKSLNMIWAIFMSAKQIVKNNRQNDVESIISLLEKEGLADLLENKTLNSKLLAEGSYELIYNNIITLRQVKNYISIIRKNPQIIFQSSTYDIQKIVKQIKQVEDLNNIYENDIEDNKNVVVEKDDLTFLDNDNINVIKSNDIINNNDIIDNSAKDENSREILLGTEDDVLSVVKALKDYNMPYNIIFVNPEICKRKEISEIDKILKVLKENNIPLNILDFSPKILEVGKAKKILSIINFLKSNNINLDILCVCPDILIKSNIKKIQSIFEKLDAKEINRNIIYSCPQLLISGNMKIFKDIKEEINSSLEDIDIVLNMAPYVFIEKIANMVMIADNNESETIDKRFLSNSNNVILVKNIEESQKVIDVLKEEDVNLGIINLEPKVITRTTEKHVKGIFKALKEKDISIEIVETNPTLLVYTSGIAVREVTDKLKENRPLVYKNIINEVPDIFIKSDSSKIDSIMKIFEKEDINYTFIDANPEVLLRDDEEEIERIVKKIKEKGYTSNEIENQPEIIISGKEKYVDRNIVVFKRNNLNLPLCAAFSMKTRVLEKNIDLYIENDFYEYLEEMPKLLYINHNKLATNIILANVYGIKLINEKDDKNEEKVNFEFLNSDAEELIQKYNMDEKVIENVQQMVLRKRDRKIKNIELYKQIYPILEEQADICLEQYKRDAVSYKKNGKVISKQKLIRETYLDLEHTYAIKGKKVIKDFNPEDKLNKKLDGLSKNKKVGVDKKIIKNQKKNVKMNLEKGE